MPASQTGLQQVFRRLANPQKAKASQRFFKTGPGEYGEGDLFLGITVPATRKFSKKCLDLPLPGILKFLKSKWHEERLLALMILVEKFRKGSSADKDKIYKLYLSHMDFINNWDLIDGSAMHIVGAYLAGKDKRVLYRLAESESLWERRVAILATFHFIRNKQYGDTLRISGRLLKDKEDLIHKATGWLLREVGKRDELTEVRFLNKHYKKMPRTMLRYAIEKFPADTRKKYLEGKI